MSIPSGWIPFDQALRWIVTEGDTNATRLSDRQVWIDAASRLIRIHVDQNKCFKAEDHERRSDLSAGTLDRVKIQLLPLDDDAQTSPARFGTPGRETFLRVDRGTYTCLFIAGSVESKWWNIEVDTKIVIAAFPFQQLLEVPALGQRGKRPRIKVVLQELYPEGVPDPAFCPRKTLKADLVKRDRTLHPLDEATLKTAIDEYNRERSGC
jgi:hypothetical protein